MGVNGEVVVAARDLVKDYGQGQSQQRVLDGVSLDVPRGRFVSIMGPSGSGKSTLLHLLGGLDVPTKGEVLIEGTSLAAMTDNERTLLRRKRIGIVYQFFNLVPVLSAEENVALPAVIAGEAESSYRPRLDRVLELVGLTEHRHKLPSELAGGQQQRAAVARALFIEPAILLADEPTGNLDMRTGADLLMLLADAQRELGQTIVMVTHDPRSAAYGDEVVLLRGGTLVAQLDVTGQVRGQARDDPAHETRGQAVLKWLQQLDAAGPSRRPSAKAATE